MIEFSKKKYSFLKTVRDLKLSLKNNILKYKFCPVCRSNSKFEPLAEVFLENFKKHNFIFDLSNFETLNINKYSCSNCGASDRDRLISMYLDGFFESSPRRLKLLDIAPSKALSKYLQRFELNYRSADLYMDNVDDKIDIRNMSIYEDNTFDVFICSHVLEHIDEDIKAMQELYRITKKNGIGVCLVPIMLSIENSVENIKYLESEHLRWKYFGQDDHVRMYSKKDFVARLKRVGFKVNEYDSNYFGKGVFTKTGIDHKSVLYVVEKTN